MTTPAKIRDANRRVTNALQVVKHLGITTTAVSHSDVSTSPCTLPALYGEQRVELSIWLWEDNTWVTLSRQGNLAFLRIVLNWKATRVIGDECVVRRQYI